jgi:hypothetical protein
METSYRKDGRVIRTQKNALTELERVSKKLQNVCGCTSTLKAGQDKKKNIFFLTWSRTHIVDLLFPWLIDNLYTTTKKAVLVWSP